MPFQGEIPAVPHEVAGRTSGWIYPKSSWKQQQYHIFWGGPVPKPGGKKDWRIDRQIINPVAAFGRLMIWYNHLWTQRISSTSRTIIDKLFSKLSRVKWHIPVWWVEAKTVSCRDFLVFSWTKLINETHQHCPMTGTWILSNRVAGSAIKITTQRGSGSATFICR